MRIMVFDVPAEYGGSLSILKQYYNDACLTPENEWIFVVSKPQLSETDNIKVIRIPWVKKSWLHRLFFDSFFASKYVKKYKPDKVISLQNVVVKGVKCFQELYVHQPLPFCEKRFSFTENKKFWVYQNIISKMIFSSIRKADSIIVQTKWMSDAICKKTGIAHSKVQIVKPDVRIPEGVRYDKGEESVFFYPASRVVYKNHDIIYKAVYELKNKGFDNFKVVLTIDKPEGFSDKYKNIEDLVDFRGYVDKETVNVYYSKSILLFPSYIESFGLPLLEARLFGCPIIASDCSFSREILNGYDKMEFFGPFDVKALINLMGHFIDKN